MKRFPRNLLYILPIETYLEKIFHYSFIDYIQEEFEEDEDQNYLLDKYVDTIILKDIKDEFELEMKKTPDLNETHFFGDYNYPNLLLVFDFNYLQNLKGFKFSYKLLISLIDTLNIDETMKHEMMYQGIDEILFFKFQQQLRNISVFPLIDNEAKELFSCLSEKERRALQMRS